MPGPHGPVARFAPMLAAVAAGLIVFHRALDYFFSQDDFLGLARAAGLVAPLGQPWRFIANQGFWQLMRPLGATDAFSYHVASLVAHATCVALLFHLMARRLAPWAALLGATFFAVHPSLFATNYWISTIGDPLALAFGLLVLLVQERTDRRRWLALPLFALSLLCKETLILLPAAVVAYRVLTGRRTAVDGLVQALAAIALVYGAYFVVLAYGTFFMSPTGPAPAAGEAAHAPYALAWGANLWQNLLTYLGWTTAIVLPLVRGFSNAVDPTAYPWAFGTLVLWLAGLALPGLRRRGWVFGGVAWLLFVMPTLPLRNHTYHYYLCAPLAGAAWCVAAAADAALARRRAPRTAWLVAVAMALVLTVNGALLVRRIETMPFLLPGLRAEPVVDRALIARNVVTSLARYRLPDGVTLLFWSPTAASLGPRGEPLPGPASRPSYWEHNVRAALLEGLAVRVMFPQVGEVRFVREFAPAPPNHLYAAYKPDGSLRVATPVEVDSILGANRRTR